MPSALALEEYERGPYPFQTHILTGKLHDSCEVAGGEGGGRVDGEAKRRIVFLL